MASYNRGMRLLHEAGGVTTTIMDDQMQRAPAFVFPEARARHASSPTGSTTTSTRSARRPRRPPDRRLQPDRAVLRRDGSSTPGSTTPRATPRARTSPARPPRRRARGSAELPRGSGALHPRVQLRDGQEELPGQHAAHPRQAGDRRGDDPPSCSRSSCAPTRTCSRARQVSNLGGFMSGVQQQRRPLRQRHHGAVHRHRTGRGERRGVLGRVRLTRAAPNGDYYSRSRSRR